MRVPPPTPPDLAFRFLVPNTTSSVCYRQHLNETVSLAEQRRLFRERWGEMCALLQAA